VYDRRIVVEYSILVVVFSFKVACYKNFQVERK